MGLFEPMDALLSKPLLSPISLQIRIVTAQSDTVEGALGAVSSSPFGTARPGAMALWGISGGIGI